MVVPMQPAPVPPPKMKPADEKKIEGMVLQPATVVVKAPVDVEVKVNGQMTTRPSIEETFTTPGLIPGRTYKYVFSAKGNKGEKTVETTKEVTVEAGKKSIVDFTNLDAPTAVVENDSAKVTVIMPGTGKVLVNDVEVTVSGKRTFDTPILVKGQRYYYTFKADVLKDGKSTTITRRVDVEAGKTITVDFTPDPVLTASR